MNKQPQKVSDEITLINDLYNGKMNDDMINCIDISKWPEDYKKIVTILRKLMAEKKEINCVNVFKESDQKTVAQLMGILNKYDKVFVK